MASFKKTNAKLFSKTTKKLTPDIEYWKKLGVPVLLKEFGAIDYIDFSPLDPNYFAVTSSVKVQIYSAITKQPVKNLNRFKETAYGGSYRSDGRLLCAGSQEASVKLFDVESKSLLRVFKGHTSPVHRSYFTSDKTHIASFSDDKTVCIWDVPSEKKLYTFSEHNDYVRAGAVSSVSPTTILSGSYDHSVRMFDSRTSSLPVFTVDHGAPVESILFFPSGGIFVSAGGTEVRIWDALAGGRLLAKLCHHHKTVTCLHLATENKRLLSGSLDRHVKVYDISSYQVVHTLDYSSAILSLAISQRDATIVAGTVDGLVSIRRREEDTTPTVKRKKNKISYRNVGDFFPTSEVTDDIIMTTSKDMLINQVKKNTEAKHDIYLRKFEYTRALDSVLMPYVTNKNPHVTVALMQELIRRKNLTTSLTGREGKSLVVVLRFLIKYIGDYRFTRVLIDVSNVLLDIYGNILQETGPDAHQLFMRLAKRLQEEVELTTRLVSLQGALQMILAGASVEQDVSSPDAVDLLQPSDAARQNFIISVS
uniref:U3 small nucleolar RNA-associated protein 15 homolog n=1 Tax=Clastoptera arizonana TaxID=38151 RepID=A0A1B6D9D7_9HEMI